MHVFDGKKLNFWGVFFSPIFSVIEILHITLPSEDYIVVLTSTVASMEFIRQ